MIRVTRINQTPLMLNSDLIEHVETTPDTVISLTNGQKYVVTEIHNERGYEEIRQKLADSYLRSAMVPHIEVCRVDRKTRTLFLQYNEHMGLKLANVDRMLPHVTRLWGGYPVVILDQWDNSIARSQSC